jgi:uncharacterized membrane protein HdeD (DUF308 family)
MNDARLLQVLGLFAVLGGVLRVASAFIPWAPDVASLEALYLAIDVMLLFGLMGIYFAHRNQLGVFGFAAFAIAEAGIASIVGKFRGRHLSSRRPGDRGGAGAAVGRYVAQARGTVCGCYLLDCVAGCWCGRRRHRRGRVWLFPGRGFVRVGICGGGVGFVVTTRRCQTIAVVFHRVAS